MPRNNKTLVLILLSSLFMILTLSEGAEGEILPQLACWKLSDSGPGSVCPNLPGNPSNKVCIEWERNGYVVGTACCSSASLGQLTCTATCVALDRPLLIAPISSPGIPGADDTALKSLNVDSLERPFRPVRPKLPVRFQGESLEGDELLRLDGSDLHYLFVLDDGTGVSALYAFSDRSTLAGTLAELDRSADSTILKRRLYEESGGVSFFADEKWQHASYYLGEGLSIDFQSGWWAEKISSLRGVGAPTWVTLFEGKNYSGSSLTFSTAWDRPTLEAFDWNDRTRSAYVWPQYVGEADQPTKELKAER